MFINQRVTGIIIGLTDKGEADRFLTVYSRELGKIKIIAKSVRKITSKLYGGTGLFNMMEIEFVEGRAFRTMIDYRILRSFDGIKNDSSKIKIGYDICEIINLLIEREQRDGRVWFLIKQLFYFLDKAKTNDRLRLVSYHFFFWNLISLLGYGIDVDKCYLCKRRLIPNNMAFNPINGGVKCPICLERGYSQYEIKISVDVIKTLRLIIKGKRDILRKIKPIIGVEKELDRLHSLFLKHHFLYQ